MNTIWIRHCEARTKKEGSLLVRHTAAEAESTVKDCPALALILCRPKTLRSPLQQHTDHSSQGWALQSIRVLLDTTSSLPHE